MVVEASQGKMYAITLKKKIQKTGIMRMESNWREYLITIKLARYR